MESYSLSLLTKKLLESGLTMVGVETLRGILGLKNERTVYRVVEDFVKNKILIKMERGKYLIAGKGNVFEIANFLYQPSYVSLETALNYWGVLSQFPFEISSVTVKKSKIKKFEGKVYSYSQVASKYFGMYTKINNSLVAVVEKALFDQLYLVSKGIKRVDFDEYDMSKIKPARMKDVLDQLKASQKIKQLYFNIIR